MAVLHPFDITHLTIVRRYADAQGHYIGELYEGNGRNALMIGASCDNFPLDQDTRPEMANPKICWRHSFLEPLPENTVRVGSFEPQLNGFVQRYMARRRFCITRLLVLNRFVEHVMEAKR